MVVSDQKKPGNQRKVRKSYLYNTSTVIAFFNANGFIVRDV